MVGNQIRELLFGEQLLYFCSFLVVGSACWDKVVWLIFLCLADFLLALADSPFTLADSLLTLADSPPALADFLPALADFLPALADSLLAQMPFISATIEIHLIPLNKAIFSILSSFLHKKSCQQRTFAGS
ncbi:hypothetical protein C2I17_09055 [Niallia circulans]|nr:hypothetical protein C2I17_09055 [Niallia circulans]